MTNVKISPMAELQEARALVEHYRNRNLLLSQGIEELTAVVGERDARIAELEAGTVPDDQPAAEETAQVH